MGISSMSKNAEGQSVDDEAPLPDDVLKGLVGGRRGHGAEPMDGDRAVALTAGAEGATHGGGFGDAAKAGFPPAATSGSGASGAIKVGPLDGAHGAAAKPGEPGAPVSPVGHTQVGLKAEIERNAGAPQPEAHTGGSFERASHPGQVDLPARGAEPSGGGPKLEGSHLGEPSAPHGANDAAIVKDFQNIHGVKLKAEVELEKSHWKGSVEKDLASGDPAKTTIKSTALDKEKASSEKATAAADDHRGKLLSTAGEANKGIASKQAGQQAVKNAEKVVNTAFDGLVKSYQDVKTGGSDDVKGAQKLVTIAQDIHKTNTDTVKMTQENLHNAVKSGKQDDIKAAKDAYIKALGSERDSKENLDSYKKKLLNTLGEKVQDKVKDLGKAEDGLKKAHQDRGDDGRPRAQSLPGNTTSPAGEKPASGHGGAATTGDAPKGHDVGKQVEKTLRDADSAKKAADVEKKAKDTADEKAKKAEENRANALKFGVKVVSEITNEAAKVDAKSKGTYKNTTGTEVTHGGVESRTEDLPDGSKLTTNTLHQTTLTQGSESWDSEYGKGANVVWKPKAEVGYQTEHTHTDSSGNKVVEKDSAYAGIEFDNKAGYSIGGDHVDAEASTKLTGHAELSHSSTSTILGLQNTTTATVAVHGEAGAKAGLHLGFDGFKAEVKVSAEVSVSATVGNETKIGDTTASIGATVFAQAKVDGKATAEVTFNPKDGTVKAKVGGGFEATAGVGADVNVGLMSDSGNGVGGTAHFKAGSVGVKFEPDLSVKDGKVDFKLSAGGYLGVGGTYDFQIKGDFNKAAQKVNQAVDRLSKTSNPFEIGAAVGIIAWSGISGFFD